ncbi:MAG: glycoside hydrolase family 31 protein [Oscillospiraceae bacterium]|nr:glycoside hydrolase family 31 protein [Oscillospiraceae bacterium]
MNFGPLKRYTISGQTAELQFKNGEARVELVAPGIVNVFVPLASPDHRSKAIEGDKSQPVPFTASQREDGLWLETEEVRVRVGGGFTVDFFDREGREVCMDYRGERRLLERISPERARLLMAEGHGAELEEPERAFQAVKRLEKGTHFYGLGDKTGFLDKRGYDYEMWNTDDPAPHVDCFKALYKTIPFFMALNGSHAYGIFLDNTFRSWFNMGQESEDYYWFAAAGGNLDYYYIAGDGLPQVLERYTYLTGTAPLPQKWTLGYHQSRWGYMTQEDVQAVADGLRDNDIPCDAIHFDIDYMQDYKVFTWNMDRYHGDPKGFLTRLAEQGFKPVTINDPGVKQEDGYFVYDEGVEKGYFARTPEGEVYINAVWPGSAAYPDFGNPAVRRWWGEKEKLLTDLGVRGIWNDMNEPASFNGPLPDDVAFSDGERRATHKELHNVYGHFMAKAAYEGLKAADGRRPFVITRACYAGTQKYSTVWTGDNHSIWAHLQMAIPQLCSLGLSGMPFAGTDLGGFGSDTTPELLARWVQFACFSPLFRNHSALGTRPQEPWRFGPETLDIYRRYVKLRYEWLPYFYDLFWEEQRTGAPILRPLAFHYPEEEAARTCNDEFLVGDRVLVAPVVQQGARRRMVWLPRGEWYDYWTREKITGPAAFVREAPLELCPIYVKAGSVLPMALPQSYVGERAQDVLLLDVYPGEGVWDHWLDDGESFDYQEGKYHQYRFTVRKDGGVDTRIVHAGYGQPYREIRIKN